MVAYELARPIPAGKHLTISLFILDTRIVEGCTRLATVQTTEAQGAVTITPEDGDGSLPFGKRRWCVGTGRVDATAPLTAGTESRFAVDSIRFH